MSTRARILLIAAVLIFGTIIVLQTQQLGTPAIWRISQGGTWLLPLVGILALTDSINPCAFSILLLTVAFLFSIGKLRRSVLQLGLIYIAGIFTAYLLIGLGLLHALHIFNTPHFMARAGAFLLIALGAINLAQFFFPSFPIKLQIPKAAHQKIAELTERASIGAVFLLGGLVGLCEFPCTGGPYLAVLGLLHDQTTYYAGVGYLILYNVILVFPLLVMLLIASDRVLLEKVRAWQVRERSSMRLGGGVVMVLLGILILFI